jgi:hypothetical protein
MEDFVISHGPTAYNKGAGRGRRSFSVGALRVYKKDEPRTMDQI